MIFYSILVINLQVQALTVEQANIMLLEHNYWKLLILGVMNIILLCYESKLFRSGSRCIKLVVAVNTILLLIATIFKLVMRAETSYMVFMLDYVEFLLILQQILLGIIVTTINIILSINLQKKQIINITIARLNVGLSTVCMLESILYVLYFSQTIVNLNEVNNFAKVIYYTMPYISIMQFLLIVINLVYHIKSKKEEGKYV